MEVTINQCWAFNSSGQRCEHPAAHTGKHMVSAEWTDAECATPTTTTVAVMPSQEVIITETAAGEPKSCVACGHKHKGGNCRCGCHEHIG